MNRNQIWHQVIDMLRQEGLPENFILRGSITIHDTRAILQLIEKNKYCSVLNVGVFLGVSTVVMAKSIPANGCVVGIDPNFPLRLQGGATGYKSELTPFEYVRKILTLQDLKDKVVLKQGFFSCPPSPGFQKAIKDAQISISDLPIIFDVAKTELFDFIFIDGDHYSQAVFSDLMVASRMLLPHGIIAIHDFTGNWAREVTHGVRLFLEKTEDYELKVSNNLGYIRRKSGSRSWKES